MIWRVLSVFLLLSLSPAYAADITAARVLSGDEIALNDGRIVRLSGIKAWPQAEDFLQTAARGRTLILQDPAPDRYGRIAATVFAGNSRISLQEDLLRRGLAFVYPATGDAPSVDTYLADEKAARLAHLGAWPQHPDIRAGDAASLYGSYGFITGKAVNAARVKNKVYVNFGPDWHTDFTIAIAAHDLRAFKHAGIDPLTWQGKTIRVRGWVVRDGGPMIDVTDPHQIEIVN
ncbi:MAG: thermonuclease family protein [Alphaproteobacteria bacterium]|nr:thermonuclease family protein [Alphaproteobacteria bacterium]